MQFAYFADCFSSPMFQLKNTQTGGQTSVSFDWLLNRFSQDNPEVLYPIYTYATVGPAKNINRKATMDVVTEAITTRLNMAFILPLSPAP